MESYFVNVNYLIKKQILFKANVTAYLIQFKIKNFNLFLKTLLFQKVCKKYPIMSIENFK